MQLVKAEKAGPLVKRGGTPQHAASVGLGALGLLAVWTHPIVGLAACIAAVLLSWESVTNHERRTALALAGFGLGVIPLAIYGTFVLGALFKVLILAAIVGGVGFVVKKVADRRAGDDDDLAKTAIKGG